MDLETLKILQSIEAWIIRWRANIYSPDVALMNIEMLVKQQEKTYSDGTDYKRS